MSTRIGQVAHVVLTEFWGGKVRGLCVQLTEDGGRSWIQLTKAEAAELAGLLSGWVVDNGGVHNG